jgi:hypothetical protein
VAISRHQSLLAKSIFNRRTILKKLILKKKYPADIRPCSTNMTDWWIGSFGKTSTATAAVASRTVGVKSSPRQ